MQKIKNLPKHIALILDGNRRWAKKRFMPALVGHREGVKRTEELIDFALEYRIPYLTFFIFSKENWKRPETEVQGLFSMFSDACDTSLKISAEKGVRVVFTGDTTDLNETIVKKMREVEKLSSNNTNLCLQLAINYSGQWDILQTSKKIAQEVKDGILSLKDVDEKMFGERISRGIPDPDLFIRTSAESRISNFMLWQLAYTELYFSPVLWPDFSKGHFEEALRDFDARERRYGQ